MKSTLKLCGWLLVILTTPQLAAAADFRIVSRVYADKEAEPFSRSITLFHAGLAYDFLEEPSETTVLDPQRGRIILLNKAQRLKSIISTSEIVEFATQMKLRAGNNKDELLRFMAEPEFKETWDKQGERLTLSSKLMTYRVVPMKAPSQEVAQQYRYFSNWYAQLNSMTNPQGLPPFARAKLDDALERRYMLPEKVELTVSFPTALGRREVKLRSEHEIAWKLLNADKTRINDTHRDMAEYREVPFTEFQQRTTPQQAARK